MIRKYAILLSLLIVSYLLLDLVSKNLRGSSNPLKSESNNSKIIKNDQTNPIQPNAQQAFSEIAKIKSTTNLDEQVVLYKQLIERVGPKLAQEELVGSGLPFDGQTHLLNHTVGDVLYEKYGTGGLSFCRDYFLSSCYHGFVIHAVADGGFEALKVVMTKCWERGEHVAVQCSHAIGHGFLAWVGYANLPAALKDCDKLATKSDNFPLYNCHDGVFMENVWAVHETGKPSKDRWVKDSDPIYPCNDTRIESRYIQACWSNQPMRMYQMFSEDLRAVASECNKLTNATYKTTCFDGLARQIHPLTKGSVDETFRMCSLMPHDWIDPCIISIARAAFSVGDREIPFMVCSRILDVSKQSCYQTLSDIIVSYARSDPMQRQALCNKIPKTYQTGDCKEV